MPDRYELDTMFYPRSVALVGVSANPAGFGATGFLSQLRRVGFPGGIYPVNPRAAEIQGLKTYPDVQSIPEVVDLVTVAVPAPGVPAVLEDCIAAGVKNVHIFSSGFSETGEEGRWVPAQSYGYELIRAYAIMNTYYTAGYPAGKRISVAGHELGHTLGLAHHFGTLMTQADYWRWDVWGIESPKPEDINELNDLY